MKKIAAMVITILSICILSLQTFAASGNLINAGDVQETTQKTIISSDQISRVLGLARGRILSSVEIQISDEGNGVLGVYADTLCHSGVKNISVTIFLDKWNESIEDYQQVDYYEYEWNESDNPGEKLSVAIVTFDLTGLPRNKEYRLRSFHVATSLDGSSEVMGARTFGILLK